MKKNLKQLLSIGLVTVMIGTTPFTAAAQEIIPSVFDTELNEGQGVSDEVTPAESEEGSLADGNGGLASRVQEIAGDPVPENQDAGQNELILEGLDMAVTIPDGIITNEDSDGFCYLYATENTGIPYVIFGRYTYAGSTFFEDFTTMMQGSYSDLKIAETEKLITLANGQMSQLVYQYTVSGYTVIDTRLAVRKGNYVYMFGSKEIPELNCMVGDLLYNTAGSFRLLSETEATGTASMPGSGSDTPAAPSSLPGQEPEDTGNSSSTESTPQVDGSIVFTESAAPYSGTWVQFSDGFQIYLPSEWVYYDISTEQHNQGVLYAAGDGSDTAAINIIWAYSEGASLNDLYQDVLTYDYSGISVIDINGIPCITYEYAAKQMRGIMFFHPSNPDYFFIFSFSPFGNESQEISDMGSAILCSLSPYNP